MAINPQYVASRTGLLKILTLVFGAIALGCGGHSWMSEYIFERYFLSAVATCFGLTFINLILHFFVRALQGNQASKAVDFIYHIIAGIVLIVGGSLMIVSAKKYDKDHCNPRPWVGYQCQRKQEKLAGGSFAVINGVFYFIAGISLALDSDDTSDLENYSKNYGYTQNYGQTTAIKSANAEDPEINQ